MARIKGSEKTGGRVKGSKNKIGADVRALAQEYGAEAIEQLVQLMRNGENGQTKVAAIKELLNRGYGQATTKIDADVNGSFVVEIVQF